jgi:hypothetical protein
LTNNQHKNIIIKEKQTWGDKTKTQTKEKKKEQNEGLTKPIQTKENLFKR